MHAAASPSFRKLPVLLVTSLLVLQGCATTDRASLDPRTWNAEKWTRCAATMVLGVAGGAIMNGGRGAAVGAAAGAAACFVINADSKQVKTAAEVERDYQRASGQRLPPQATLTEYTTKVEPGTSVRRGEPIRIISDITAVRGSLDPIRQVREEVRLYTPESTEPFKTGSKVAGERPGSGAYQNTFTVNLDSDTPQGIYKIETAVFINDKPADTRTNSVQLVWVGDVMHVALLD